MKQTRSALSKEFIRPSLRHEEINRPMGGLLLIGLAGMGGGLMLQDLSPPREWVLRIIAVALIIATVGGAIYHPIRRFWMGGAFAGFVIAAVSLVTTFFYVRWRAGVFAVMWSGEFIIPLGIGALPGIGMYYLMMRNETVDEP
jgi:hypothetical protein